MGQEYFDMLAAMAAADEPVAKEEVATETKETPTEEIKAV
jgi:hypothetical protein